VYHFINTRKVEQKEVMKRGSRRGSLPETVEPEYSGKGGEKREFQDLRA
jgi:hypothetical protein